MGAYYNFTGFHEYSDSISLVYGRADSVTWACRLRIKDCVDNAKASFDEFMNANETDRSEYIIGFNLTRKKSYNGYDL